MEEERVEGPVREEREEEVGEGGEGSWVERDWRWVLWVDQAERSEYALVVVMSCKDVHGLLCPWRFMDALPCNIVRMSRHDDITHRCPYLRLNKQGINDQHQSSSLAPPDTTREE